MKEEEERAGRRAGRWTARSAFSSVGILGESVWSAAVSSFSQPRADITFAGRARSRDGGGGGRWGSWSAPDLHPGVVGHAFRARCPRCGRAEPVAESLGRGDGSSTAADGSGPRVGLGSPCGAAVGTHTLPGHFCRRFSLTTLALRRSPRRRSRISWRRFSLSTRRCLLGTVCCRRRDLITSPQRWQSRAAPALSMFSGVGEGQEAAAGLGVVWRGHGSAADVG